MDMIGFHKEVAAAQEESQQPHYRDQHKRPKYQAQVTPDEKKRPAFPDSIDTEANRVLFATYMQNNDTSPTYGDTNPPDPPLLNKSPGNQSKDVHWVQRHLASSREDNWICTKGAGLSSYYSNPTKAVYTLFNWHNKDITASDLQAIE